MPRRRPQSLGSIFVCTKKDVRYGKIELPSRLHIQTPEGLIVPGMSGKTAGPLWKRYARVMNQTRKQLEAKGYRLIEFPDWRDSGTNNEGRLSE